jgi:hypothetical protein
VTVTQCASTGQQVTTAFGRISSVTSRTSTGFASLGAILHQRVVLPDATSRNDVEVSETVGHLNE